MPTPENCCARDQTWIYVYPCNARLCVERVRKVFVLDCGTHKIKDACGKVTLVSPGWCSIKVIDRCCDE